MMPEITGPELLSYLRVAAPVPRHACRLPDGQGRPDFIDKLIKAGAAAVITKPFDAMHLPEDLTRILDEYRAGMHRANIAAQ
jgi:DNA-binding NarL/FixJ family response regulator